MTTDITREAAVYVIGTKGGPYKIGHTNNLGKRVMALQSGSHSRLDVHGAVLVPRGTGADIERKAHLSLRDARVLGEWFAVSVDQALSAVSDAASAVTGTPAVAWRQEVVEIPDWRGLELGDACSAFRARHKLSRARLAELLDLPNPRTGGQVTVARWENGDREPVPFLRRALADIERELARG